MRRLDHARGDIRNEETPPVGRRTKQFPRKQSRSRTERQHAGPEPSERDGDDARRRASRAASCERQAPKRQRTRRAVLTPASLPKTTFWPSSPPTSTSP